MDFSARLDKRKQRKKEEKKKEEMKKEEREPVLTLRSPPGKQQRNPV